MLDLCQHRDSLLMSALVEVIHATQSLAAIASRLAALERRLADFAKCNASDITRATCDSIAADAARAAELSRAVHAMVAGAHGSVVSMLAIAFEHDRRERAAAASDGQQILDRPAGSS